MSSVIKDKYFIGRLRKDRIYIIDAIERDKELCNDERVLEWQYELRDIDRKIVSLMARVYGE